KQLCLVGCEGLRGKRVSLREACECISDGDVLAIGGLTIHRKPMSMLHELIRLGRRGLSLLVFGGGPDVDLLIASGMVGSLDAAYVGFEILGFAPNFRSAVERGEIKFTEHTEYSIMAGLQANLLNAEFIPSRLLLGTDVLKSLGYKTFKSPLTGEALVAYPRITPDVALLHVQRCDEYGNAKVDGVLAIDLLLAKSSRRVILTSEKIVSAGEVAGSPFEVNLPSTFVDMVVESPLGAHPTSCYPYYTYDLWHMISYLEYCRRGMVNDYLRKYVAGVESFESYLDLVGEDALSRIMI
ncbi:CoA transferase subunit A, partial [Candidatus Bathyarchaeota archaeon]|nr:CoA transferase subunit A [Candidatus Bathyarchaeota archaeon]